MNGKAAFIELFGKEPEYRFAAPGRTELGGNHTDHQHGCVLAAAVNLETVAWVTPIAEKLVRLQSEGYPFLEVSLEDLSVHPEEFGTTTALIRGVAAEFAARGAEPGGFEAYVTSTVFPGSGLSSSAAFEVLLGAIFNELYHGGACNAIELAQIGQKAENLHFGKPSGLMDQMASAVGNACFIDFGGEQPLVERIPFDFSTSGYTLCVVNVGADHADLTGEYAAITNELKKVCEYFGKSVLREVKEADFWQNLAAVRAFAGDRAVLRAIHIFNENKRARQQAKALYAGDFSAFLELVRQSGASSRMLLQNVVSTGATDHQEAAVVLEQANYLLEGEGAARIHGGGFGGTIQAFVPNAKLARFVAGMEALLGEGCCFVLSVNPYGGRLAERLTESAEPAAEPAAESVEAESAVPAQQTSQELEEPADPFESTPECLRGLAELQAKIEKRNHTLALGGGAVQIREILDHLNRCRETESLWARRYRSWKDSCDSKAVLTRAEEDAGNPAIPDLLAEQDEWLRNNSALLELYRTQRKKAKKAAQQMREMPLADEQALPEEWSDFSYETYLRQQLRRSLSPEELAEVESHQALLEELCDHLYYHNLLHAARQKTAARQLRRQYEQTLAGDEADGIPYGSLADTLRKQTKDIRSAYKKLEAEREKYLRMVNEQPTPVDRLKAALQSLPGKLLKKQSAPEQTVDLGSPADYPDALKYLRRQEK